MPVKKPKLVYTYKACRLSDDEKHRFALMRSWEHALYTWNDGASVWDRSTYDFARWRVLIYLMLNPSTADDIKNDPTAESCVRIANYHGYSHILVGNLWSYRSKDWKVIRDEARIRQAECGRPDPAMGNEPNSDRWIKRMLAMPGHVLGCSYVRADVCLAWGSHVLDIPGAGRRIQDLLHLYRSSPLAKQPLLCLGTTSSGNPNHPLFQAETTPLIPWDREQEAIRNAA